MRNSRTACDQQSTAVVREGLDSLWLTCWAFGGACSRFSHTSAECRQCGKPCEVLKVVDRLPSAWPPSRCRISSFWSRLDEPPGWHPDAGLPGPCRSAEPHPAEGPTTVIQDGAPIFRMRNTRERESGTGAEGPEPGCYHGPGAGGPGNCPKSCAPRLRTVLRGCSSAPGTGR